MNCHPFPEEGVDVLVQPWDMALRERERMDEYDQLPKLGST